jgi:hypothetical protein
MSTPQRGLDLPSIPRAEYAPRPPHITDYSAEWGVSIRTWDGAEFQVDVLRPDQVKVDGRFLVWHELDNGTGVRLGRARNEPGVPIAIARAVPLS